MVSWAWAMIAHHVDMMAAGITVTLCIAGCLNTDTPMSISTAGTCGYRIRLPPSGPPGLDSSYYVPASVHERPNWPPYVSNKLYNQVLIQLTHLSIVLKDR